MYDPYGAFIGNRAAVEFVRATFASGRPAHAYLITGPVRVGKRTLAQAMAAALLCLKAPAPPANGGQINSTATSSTTTSASANEQTHLGLPGLETQTSAIASFVPSGFPENAVTGSGGTVPCGVCRACLMVAREAHPDVRLVETESGRRAITIEQIRQLEHAASLKPYDGRRKVFILHGVDAMQDAAANALLKTLEEPPGDTVLILTAGDASQVLPTIASRCREIALRPVPATEIIPALRARGAPEEHASLVARLASGRPGWARLALEDERLLAARRDTIELLETLLAQPRVSRLASAGQVVERSPDAAQVKDTLDTWLGWWRDALLVHERCEDLVVNADRLEALRRLGAGHPPNAIWRTMARIQETRQQLDANANARLAVESLLLSLPEPL